MVVRARYESSPIVPNRPQTSPIITNHHPTVANRHQSSPIVPNRANGVHGVERTCEFVSFRRSRSWRVTPSAFCASNGSRAARSAGRRGGRQRGRRGGRRGGRGGRPSGRREGRQRARAGRGSRSRWRRRCWRATASQTTWRGARAVTDTKPDGAGIVITPARHGRPHDRCTPAMFGACRFLVKWRGRNAGMVVTRTLRACRFLVKWRGQPKSAATWASGRKLPPELLFRFVETRCVRDGRDGA